MASQMSTILKEGERLYNLGLGIHWLRPNSKIPVKSGWSGSKRDDWKTLLDEYKSGYGLGIRLGHASKINDRYLGVIDLDLRSPAKCYFEEAMAVIENEVPGLYDVCPLVSTGRGFGSSHLYFLSETPIKSRKLGRSKEEVKVQSATSEKQTRAVKEGLLTQSEIDSGWRLKSAWEVDLMGDGRQVVAPPTIHPDTNTAYQWVRGLL